MVTLCRALLKGEGLPLPLQMRPSVGQWIASPIKWQVLSTIWLENPWNPNLCVGSAVLKDILPWLALAENLCMGGLPHQMFHIRDVIIVGLWVTRPVRVLITSIYLDEDQIQGLDLCHLPIFDGRASIAVRYAVQSRGQGTP